LAIIPGVQGGPDHDPEPPDRDPEPPDLDRWLRAPAIRVAHRRESTAAPERLWRAASELRLGDAPLLGRLIRWRIPGVRIDSSFDELFRNPPFLVLAEGEASLVSGLVGRIWTLRRDYPLLADAAEFGSWSHPGTAKVLFAHWVESLPGGRSALRSEARLEAFGIQGSLGLRSVRPLIRASQHLVGTDALAAVVRRAERESQTR
jgi:hypothetical protein